MLGFNKLNKTAALATLAVGLLFVGHAGASTSVKIPAVTKSKVAQTQKVVKAKANIAWFNGSYREYLA